MISARNADITLSSYFVHHPTLKDAVLAISGCPKEYDCFFFSSAAASFINVKINISLACKDGVRQSSRRWYTGLGGSVQRIWLSGTGLLVCRSFVRPRTMSRHRWGSRSVVGSNSTTVMSTDSVNNPSWLFLWYWVDEILSEASQRTRDKCDESSTHTPCHRSFFEDAAWTTVEYHGVQKKLTAIRRDKNLGIFQTCFLHALGVFWRKLWQKIWLHSTNTG